MLSTNTSFMFGYFFENKTVLELYSILQNDINMKISISNMSVAQH